jgi:NAD(P)-dependent dehydrogenase (short-subunit alcohol dehydrogenase family)
MSTRQAIVTGGGSGLGAVISDHLHRDNRHVIIIDRDNDAGSQLADRLRDGPGATSIECDLLDRAQLLQTMSRIATAGPLSLLVNNAGGWLPGPQFPDGDQWEDSLVLNLHVPMLLTKVAGPALRKEAPYGGAVVNIASSGGWDSDPYQSPEYGAAKAGLIRYTTASAGLRDRGIRVSCLIPHWIGLDRAKAEYERMSASDRELSGGLVAPDMIASTVVEHADDRNSAGRVTMIRANRAPYDVDPASYDPHRGAG